MSTKQNKLYFYDTFTRRKKPFESMEEGKVKMYACGPTVYSDPHIGNFRTFLAADLIRRWLEYRGYDVFMVMNITDIDDKTIHGSGVEGVSLKEFTEGYIGSFFRGIELLNIKRATTYPKATEYIEQIKDFIEALIDKKAAYVTSDGIYFNIKKFDEYGKLGRVDLTKVKRTKRMLEDEYDKEAVNDFVLWKMSAPEELERGIYYESPWGKGRPGWHIECSAMTHALLGEALDIHLGGEDLIFPHHENEKAQSECFTGKQFVRYWMHIRHLMINGKKMSKSLGNYVSFDEVLSEYSPEAFRYFYMSAHYRRPLDYTDEAMKSAENSVARLENTLNLVEEAFRKDGDLNFTDRERSLLKTVNEHKILFEEAMDNDLDTHGALDILHSLSKTINECVDGTPNKGVLLKASDTYKKLLNVLGLFEKREAIVDEVTENIIEYVIRLRESFREDKNFQLSDEIREELAKAGVELTDTLEGTAWKIKKN